MPSHDDENALELVRMTSMEGESPPQDRTLLAHAHQYSPSKRTEWNWSGFPEAHILRRWKWDEYRLAACREPPISLDCKEAENPKITYIQQDAIADFLQDDNEVNQSVIKLVVSFTSGISAPYKPSLDSTALLDLTSLFGVQSLREHYPSQITTSFWRNTGPTKDTWSELSFILYKPHVALTDILKPSHARVGTVPSILSLP